MPPLKTANVPRKSVYSLRFFKAPATYCVAKTICYAQIQKRPQRKTSKRTAPTAAPEKKETLVSVVLSFFRSPKRAQV